MMLKRAVEGCLVCMHAWPPVQKAHFRAVTTARSRGSPAGAVSQGAKMSGSWEELKNESPVYLRRSLEALAPVKTFKVAGVSFGQERQEAIMQMQAGNFVMLLREPWNVHDDKAVAVHKLTGEIIGWVPRSMNESFQVHELLFGFVEFVGSVPESGIWGMRVSAQPSLMPAFVSAFPWQLLPQPAAAAAGGAAKQPTATPRNGRLPGRAPPRRGAAAKAAPEQTAAAAAAPQEAAPAGATAPVAASWEARLQAALGPQHWQRLTQEAESRAMGVCEATAVPAQLRPLEMVPVWQYNEAKQVIKLMRLAVVCPEVALAQRLLDLPEGSPERARAESVLLANNKWHIHDEHHILSSLAPDDHSVPVQQRGEHMQQHGNQMQQHVEFMARLRDRVVAEKWKVDLFGQTK